MARRVGLSAYRLEISHYHGEQWKFTKDTDEDGHAAVRSYLKSRDGQIRRLGDPDPLTGEYTDARALKLIKLADNRSQRMLAGIFMKGEGGLEQEIWDVDSPKKVPAYTTQRSDALLTPLYFRMHLPENATKGVVLLQTFGGEGLKGYLQTDLRRYFQSAVPRATVKLRQLVDREVLMAFAEQGKLQDVILIHSGKTERSRHAMENNQVAGDPLGDKGDKLALRLHKQGGWPKEALAKLITAVKRGESPTKHVTAQDADSADDLVVEIKSGGRTQKFSLLEPDDSPLREDITEEVRLGDNGFPTWESLHRAAKPVWERIDALVYQ